MGNCPSSFRAQFTPSHESGANGTADIIMKPVDDDNTGTEKIKAAGDWPKEEEKVPEIVVDSVTNGTSMDLKPANVKSEIEALIVEFVDVCAIENANNHHTDCYEAVQRSVSKLLVRRGQPFKLNLVLNRSFSSENDILCLVFTLRDAKTPSYSQGTQIILPVLSPDENIYGSNEWHIEDVSLNENSVSIQVTPAANAIIGEWLLEIDSKIKDIDAVDFKHKVKDPIILLFNPWCENDDVYLPEPEKRKEYVMSDSGLIWRGIHNRLRPCIWNFAQFEENILECCLYMLASVGRLSVVKRADPVRVSRHISAVLNSRDDAGVLVGNWTGKYKGGQNPTCWCGSQAILQKFYKTKKPVKYGQCWVFSGVFTTVCRALGIPARAVTNFSSAHDTHNSLTVDVFFDCDGKPVEKLNIDSVWNFHVWTEVWMARPDLEPGGYNGWQAVDATPQEESDGVYQCGPASVAAIKRGEIMKGFDTQFLFAEVNADKVYWRYHGPKQPLKLIRKCSEEIGQCISTKAVGKFEREDITCSYKHDECSKSERQVMLRALRQCKNAFSRYYLNDELEDVQFEFSLLDDIIIGEPFTVVLKATNKKPDSPEYNVKVTLRVDSAMYTGCVKNLVKKDDFEVQLGPGTEQEMTMKLEYANYERALVDQCAFIVSATAHVQETCFDYCAQDDFRVRMPDISIQVEGEIVQNQPITVTVFFTNPLPKPLKNGVFVIEGPGLGAPLTLKCKGAIKAGADAKVTCKMTPKSAGAKVIAAKFQSKELNDVDGYHEIFVTPASEANEKENNSHL